MTDRLSEFTWYSRLAVWVGALMLLMQSITGRGFGVMTVLAVILVGGGLLAFVSGLALDARPTTTVVGPPRVEEAVEDGQVAAGPSVEEPIEVSDGVAAADAETGGTLPAIEVRPQVEALPRSQTVAEPVTPSAANDASGATARVPTVVVAESSRELGTTCPFCAQEIRVRQLAACCPMCGTAQHANCWTENYFHCAKPGCEGGGSLEPPQARNQPGS